MEMIASMRVKAASGRREFSFPRHLVFTVSILLLANPGEDEP
jgi:hypothetical protein